ncbi:MAG: two-component regulator propeller domain-containing protein [Bacteriovoracaceae bacterium]|nr:histidine kinase [Bacteroidota bacterium]
MNIIALPVINPSLASITSPAHFGDQVASFDFRLMFLRIVITVIAIRSLCMPLQAQDRSMIFERFTIENGLSNNSINNILQTKDGFLWIATKDGLNRYDGQSFKYYKHHPSDQQSLPENYVNSLLETPDGTLLIGTWGKGLCAFDPYQETFFRIDAAENDDAYIQCMLADRNGNIWYGTVNGGLNSVNVKMNTHVSYRKSSPRHQPFPTDNVTSIVEDREGHLWVGTGDAGLLEFDPATGSVQQYPRRSTEPQSTADNTILTVMFDGVTQLWIGAQSGAHRFNLTTRTWMPFPEVPLIQEPYLQTSISQIVKDRNGRIWTGTYEYLGLFMLEHIGKPNFRSIHIRRENDNATSIVSDRIRWIYEDRQKNMWFGTEDGIAKLPVTQPFYQYRHLPLRSNSISGRVVSGIYEDNQKNLWVGLAGGGFNKISLATEKIEHHFYEADNRNSISGNTVTTVYEDRSGVLWFGTMSTGLNKYHPSTKTFTHYRQSPGSSTSLRSDWVQQILETRNGEFLVATNDGLQLFDRSREIFYTYQPKSSATTDSLPTTFSPNALYEDRDGNVWIGTWLDGLYRYDPNTKILKHYMPDERDPYSISSSKVTTIIEDSHGFIWIGTHSNGLNKFDKNTERFQQYSILNGLPNDVVFGILEDAHGFLWISTMNGLAKFNPTTETFRVYDEADGLVHNQFNWRSSFKNAHGIMYFGGMNGFVSFHPDSIKSDSTAPRTAITSFKIFDKEVPMQHSRVAEKEIELRYDQNFFSIEFIVLDLAPLQKHQFAYMLKGVDPQWVNSKTRRTAYYTNIAQGTYYFYVKANNADGLWGEPTALKIVILPAWWMSWWFKVIVLFSVLTAVVMLYNYRVRQLIKIERIRFNISSDLHDEIGSNLSSISVDSQALLQSSALTETDRELSTDISKTAKETVEAMRDIVWFINPKNDIGEDIVFKMKETAAKLLIGIQWTYTVSPEIRFDALDLELRRHFFLIYKETLTNVVRHSNASQCNITITKEGSQLHIVIQDNGVGFNTLTVKKNNGLLNMFHRAEKILAHIEVNSEEGKGTRMELRVPLKK